MQLDATTNKTAFAATGLASSPKVYSVADQGVYSLTNFLSLIIVSRACDATQVGLYSLAFNMTVILTTFQIAVVSYPFTVYSARIEDEELETYTGSTLVHQFFLSIVAVLAIYVGRYTIAPWFGGEGLSALLATLQWVVVPILLRDYLRRFFFARYQFATAFLFDLAVAMTQISALLTLAYTEYLTPSTAYWVVGVTTLLACLTAFARKRDFEVDAERIIPDFRQNWRVGKWLLASRFLATLGPLIYPWLLAAFHETADVGLFAVYQSLCFLLNPILLAIGNFVGPAAANAQHRTGCRGLRKVVRDACLLTLVLMCVLVTLIAVFGKPFVGYLFGDHYPVTPLLMVAFAVNQLLWALPLPVEAGLSSIERADVISRSYLIGAAITLIAGLYLIDQFSIGGAVVSMIAVNLVTGIYRAWRFVSLTTDDTHA